MKPTSPTPTLVYRIPQAARLLSLGRSSVYRLVDAGELDLIKLGRRSSAITRASLIKFCDARGVALPDGF